MEPVLLSVTDACAAIGVQRTKIYEMLKSQQLDSITIGRKRLITVASIRRFVADAARQPEAA